MMYDRDHSKEITMSDNTEIAILAGGCFWRAQELLRRRDGVISTRVGYTGGKNDNPTDRNQPGHAEAVDVIFDPERTSYRDILEFFFQIHTRRPLPPGLRHRLRLPLRDLLRERPAASGRRGHDRRRRRRRPADRQRRDHDQRGRPFFDSQGRATRTTSTATRTATTATSRGRDGSCHTARPHDRRCELADAHRAWYRQCLRRSGRRYGARPAPGAQSHDSHRADAALPTGPVRP